jgi:hypothetical protein
MYFERRLVRGALGALGALVAVLVANVVVNWVRFSILTPPIQTKNASSKKRRRFLSAKPWNYESYVTHKSFRYVPQSGPEQTLSICAS